MGRHRRTTAEGHTAAAVEPHLRRPPRGVPRHRRGSPAVRTGLLGASAAVAMGVVAVTAGVLPGGDSYSAGGDGGSDRVRSADTPSAMNTLGATDGPAGSTTAHPDGARSATGSGPRTAHPPSGDGASRSTPHHPKTAEPKRTAPRHTATEAPSRTPSADPSSSAPQTHGSAQSAAEAEVLRLVNQARGDAGCSPLRSDPELADLAEAFSEQMADEGFFDHTDPQGLSPWDRAAKAGITDLGGENIARGQADAKAVMDSWLASPGHRANILNCEYRTIGIGVHFGAGGPWWTQDFGF